MTKEAESRPESPVRPKRPRLAREFGELLRELEEANASGWLNGDEVLDVVIVGSGYGGSVAAQTLAGLVQKDTLRKISVCVLERGREYLPGEFPKRFEDVPGHMRRTNETTALVTGNPEGLFDVRMGPDVVALVANGVGGGSLINAGVLLEPRLSDFLPGSEAHTLVNSLKKGKWYAKARRDLGGLVKRNGLVRNRIGLHPKAASVIKTAALKTLGAGLKEPAITVSMAREANPAGVELSGCELCGDCMSGCNVGAKDSLDTNLLDLAERAGARIYGGASVLSLKQDDKNNLWILRVCHTDASLQKREIKPFEIKARHVILAAGTLGSTEILLRSRTDQLVFSPRLGQGFSCNGDNLSAVYGMAGATNACADEDLPLDERNVGPTITGTVTMETTTVATPSSPATRSFQLQEFSVPGAMKRIFQELVTTAKTLNDLPLCDPEPHGKEGLEALDPLAVDDEALGRTLIVGTIGHDEADGVLYLPHAIPPRGESAQQGTIGIRWLDARHGARLNGAHQCVDEAVGELRQEGKAEPSLVANPMWRLLPQKLESLVSQPRGPILTVHPLGGSRIGPRDISRHDAGVVDPLGRVYDFSPACEGRSDGLFKTLIVLDGSIIPGSLGVNPSLTITATAMRAMPQLCKDWGYQSDAAQAQTAKPVLWARRRAPVASIHEADKRPEPPAGRGSTEIQLVERLRGEVPLAFGSEKRDCIVELTLAYHPLPIGQLMGPLHRRMVVHGQDPASRVRIYDKGEWDARHLKLETDEVRSHWTLFEGRLGGTLAVLGREPSHPWWRITRSVFAWLVNRGTRDIWQRLFDKTPAQQRGESEGFLDYAASLLKMGTRAGEVRRLDYDLAITEVMPSRGDLSEVDVSGLQIGRCDVIRGSKRLTYGLRANPWRQLTLLSLDEMPAMRGWRTPVLELDGRFLAGQGFPLLRITRQRNSAVALADLASFGLYMTRLLASIHLWTFRKPDTQPRRKPDRLPGPVAGLVEPEITELVVDRYPGTEKPVTIRLTRYRQTIGPRVEPGRPLVMIHGYSASGNTFTHPSLPTSAAAYFCAKGRDVWVVDLRTSSGLPSSTYPWAMEQVGLIDIPAALMHIRNVTDQQVDVLAHCIGCVMLSMALLTDAEEVTSNKIELGPDTWLTNHHLGLLKAFNNQVAGQPHPVIRKLILSQKGPVLRYTDDNMLRAFLLQSVRRWLMRDDYQFQPSDDPGAAEQLMDRLLASIPYPRADYNVENPFRPCARVPWTATRHRMDALYGRAFDASNMHPKTLAAIDDIFGPINLETVSQTIHFARFNAITNQAGRGEFVTRQRLCERWGSIDTYAIHGANNGLVDVLTQTLLRDHLKSSGVPFSEPDEGAAVYDSLGHQDVLMGTRSAEVFDDLQRFLKRPAPTAQLEDWPDVVLLPWSGPRFRPPRPPRVGVGIACLSDPTQGSGSLHLVPAVRCRDAEGGTHFVLVRDTACVSSSPPGSSAEWMFAEPRFAAMAAHDAALQPGNAVLGWLAVVVYRAAETTGRLSPLDDPRTPARGLGAVAATPTPSRPGAAMKKDATPRLHPVIVTDPPTFSAPIRMNLNIPTLDTPRFVNLFNAAPVPHAYVAPAPGPSTGVLEGVQRWLERQRSEDVELAFVELADVEAAQAMVAADTPDDAFAFAFGSCQYVTGLVDAKVGQASLHALAKAMDTSTGRVNLALFIGDQIYADATAGLIDPTRRDELYDQPNDKAMRASGMRAVLRRVPSQMLLDDHEIKDNWEPLPWAVARRRRDADKRNFLALKRGAHAWAKFQRMQPLDADADGRGVGDLQFMAGGRPFWFADTRTGRSARGSTTEPRRRRILNEAQWLNLQQWLLEHKDEVKFIATPSILLPRRRRTVAGEGGEAHSDAWDGFPASMDELLAFVVDKQITNTVFLSGDEHHSMVTEAWLRSAQSPGEPVKIVSVHSSGLYAPYSFANGNPDDMAQQDAFSLPSVSVDALTRFAPKGDGFARLQVRRNVLHVQWVKPDGQMFPDWPIALS